MPQESRPAPRSHRPARPIGSLPPQIGAADRWLTYYPICLALIGALAVAVGLSSLLALGPAREGMVGVVLGALYIAVAIGLKDRKLWAWRVNYWVLLLIQPITVAGVYGLWKVERFALLTAWPSGLALFLGLWSALNMPYFRRRRHLFEEKPPTETS